MAKGDKGDVINRSEQGRTNTGTQYQDLYNDLNTQRQQYTQNSNQERQTLLSGYGNLANSPTGGLDPDVISRLRGIGSNLTSGGGGGAGEAPESGDGGGGGGGGASGGGGNPGLGGPSGDYYSNPEGYWTNLANGGGVDMNALLMSIPQLQEIAGNGGFDDASRGNINGFISGYQGIAQNGGFDDARRAGVESNLQNLSDIGQTGGFDPNDLAGIRGDIGRMRDIAQSGGYDPAALAQIQSDIANARNLSNTGGIDPADLDSIRGYFGNLQNLVNTGGMSADDIARFRGTGYDEFARTGGYSDEDISNIRTRATSGIPALLAQNTSDLNRMRTLQGGYSPGYASAMSRMTRQSSQALSDASLSAELGIKDKVNAGRQWGIAGQESTEKDLNTILSQTRLGAANSLASNAPSFYNTMAGNRLNYLKAATEGESNLQADLANRRLAASQGAASAGTDLDKSIAAARTAASQAAASGNIDYANAQTNNRLNAMTGGGNLQLGMNKAINDARLGALGQISSTQQGAQGLRQQGMIAGAGGLTTIAQGRTSRDLQQQQIDNAARAAGAARSSADALAWAQLNSQNERYIGQLQQQGMLAGLGGMTQIYGMDPTLSRDRLQLDIMNGMSNSDRGYLGIEGQMAASGGTNWMGMLGSMAPFLGGLGGGGGGNGGGGGYYDDWVNSGYQYGGSGDWGDPYGSGGLGGATPLPNPSI